MTDSMNTFTSFVIKETRHILRDPRTVMILFGMPLVMMLLFGFAISTDIRDVRTVAVMPDADAVAQRTLARIDASEMFTVTGRAATPAEAERMIRSGRADMAVVFARRTGKRTATGGPAVQIMADATDPNTAVRQAAYAAAAMAGGEGGAAQAEVRMLYNPRMLSSYNFVPGIMGLLLMLICAMMTSVSIAREKERGTMEGLLVSPVRPVTVIVAKAVPYFVLAVAILCCILLLARFALGVPMQGGVAGIVGVSLIYIVLALALGLLISTVAETQLVAMLASAVLLLLPSLLLSGMIYPVESMPRVLQWVSCVIPARWYIEAMRKLMVMGVGIGNVLTEVAILSAMAAALLVLALKKFRNRL